MTKREALIKQIGKEARSQGLDWCLIREGGRHSVFGLNGTRIVIPRHREIGERLAETIRKQAGEQLGEDWWRK